MTLLSDSNLNNSDVLSNKPVKKDMHFSRMSKHFIAVYTHGTRSDKHCQGTSIRHRR